MSNLDSLVLEPIEQPLSNTTNMLSNEDRVLCNMTPLQRLYSIDEDTYEELVCVWAYSCLGNKGYTEVYRVGQAGDKGRDVLAYYDRVKGAFDLYQCKQYKSALTYSDLCGEMGKLLIYTFNNTYPIPQNYYILCPKDVSQSFVDLLSNNGKNLKIKLKNDWETVVNKKVGTNWVALNEELSTYIDEFDFNIVKKIGPIKFIDEIRQSPYYFYYFGGGFNMIKRTPLQVPHSPINTERNYIQNLNDAYSEHAGYIINVIDDDNEVVSKYRKHLDRARISFYESEEVKIASRKSTAPDSDEFNDLVTSIERYIGNELDDDYPDGFTKVKSVEKKAGTYNMPTSMLISHLVDSNVCVGVCHQLSNENRIKWTVNE
ncbi:ABC-three component system protein [Parabacteroides johnsonii]|uniref:ABC-three component system protein n=1 Tax=Parabacteroides johnsonii TaxID=387661 RepID=UPI0021CB8AB3|nr:ABC-three component system protein [Parabacteroides johnsonii]